MNIEQLEDFLELARELNFSRAAARRNVTQPAFSRRIAALEASMQAQLITRTTRSVSLTPAGLVLRNRAETLVRLMAQTRQEVLEAAGRERRSLNLAATHALSYTFVPRWLMQVAGPSEIGTLNMVSDTTRQCLNLVRAGEVSFFICHAGAMPPEELPERQFLGRQIGSDSLVPLCGPDDSGAPLWRLHGPETVPLIAYGEASGLREILERYWIENGRPNTSEVMSSVLASTNLEMAKAGQGVAYLPRSLADSDIGNGTLVRAGKQSDEVPVRVMIFRPRARLSQHCEAFWEQVETHSTIDAT